MCSEHCLYCVCPCVTLSQKDCCTCCRYEKKLNIPICLVHGATLLFQNNSVNCCWVLTRGIMALFAIFCLINGYYWFITEWSINKFPYIFIYLSQWTNLVAVLYFILSFILTYKIYRLQHKGVDITTISIDEISGFGLKTLLYFVEPSLVITLTAFTVVSVVYWVVEVNPQHLYPFWATGFTSIAGHGIVVGVAIFDYYCSYKRMLFADVMVSVWYGITFLIWSILFHHLFGLTDQNGNPYIQQVLNWNDPVTAITVSLVSLAALIPVHLFYTLTKNWQLYQCNKNDNVYEGTERSSDVEKEISKIVHV